MNVRNVETETTNETSTVPQQATGNPPPPKLTKRTKVTVKNLISFGEDAFKFQKDRTTPQTTKERSSAGCMALHCTVKRLNIAYCH